MLSTGPVAQALYYWVASNHTIRGFTTTHILNPPPEGWATSPPRWATHTGHPCRAVRAGPSTQGVHSGPSVQAHPGRPVHAGRPHQAVSAGRLSRPIHTGCPRRATQAAVQVLGRTPVGSSHLFRHMVVGRVQVLVLIGPSRWLLAETALGYHMVLPGPETQPEKLPFPSSNQPVI